MRVQKAKKEKLPKKARIIYAITIIICAIAIALAIYRQFFYQEDYSKNIVPNLNEEDSNTLKNKFEDLFINDIEIGNSSQTGSIKKINDDKKIIYRVFEGEKIIENSYNIQVHIPTINIDSEIIKKYNEEINNEFIQKVRDILDTKNKNIIYTVEYVATLENNILSLMIRSDYKEGNNPQKVVIKTYNYDIIEDKELTLQELLQRKNRDLNEVQNTIKQEIEVEQKKAEDLKNLGYNIFSRDINSDMYKIENTDQFFVVEDRIYIIYPYGNTMQTNEVDLVIL